MECICATNISEPTLRSPDGYVMREKLTRRLCHLDAKASLLSETENYFRDRAPTLTTPTFVRRLQP